MGRGKRRSRLDTRAVLGIEKENIIILLELFYYWNSFVMGLEISMNFLGFGLHGNGKRERQSKDCRLEGRGEGVDRKWRYYIFITNVSACDILYHYLPFLYLSSSVCRVGCIQFITANVYSRVIRSFNQEYHNAARASIDGPLLYHQSHQFTADFNHSHHHHLCLTTTDPPSEGASR